MVMACVNPHGLGLARTLESAPAIKIHSASICDEHLLVESLVASHEPLHQLSADAASLIPRKHEQVRVVNDQAAVRNGVAKSDKHAAIPGGNQRVRSQQRLVQQIGLLCRRPLVGAIKS